jgi:phage tail-like protein
MIPPGLERDSQRLITYLPGIYHTAFMRRFLGIFEAILTPIEWQIDNFDLFLDPGAAPAGFLPWLASWFDVAFDPSWDEVQRRQLLREAHQIYARRGTKWALSRVLEIYTGESPTIVDVDEDLAPFSFKVVLPHAAARRERAMIERLIDAHKPAYTLYTLEFAP